MSSDKILSKIQLQINELAPSLELFVDTNIQPSVQDCEALQKMLVGLQENLAVYKYNKQNKELSPSFKIHAKLNEKENQEEKKAEIVKEIKESVKLEKEEKTEAKHIAPETKTTETAKPKMPLAFGINDKFRFMNELFSQNAAEYNIAVEQLSNLNNWHDTEIYLNSLRNVYGWQENREVVKYFYSLIKKHFD
jgi:hypothetical protein